MKLYSSLAVSLLILSAPVLKRCQEPPNVISDFCEIAGPDIDKLKNLTAEETAPLKRSRKEGIASLRRNQKKQCP